MTLGVGPFTLALAAGVAIAGLGGSVVVLTLAACFAAAVRSEEAGAREDQPPHEVVRLLGRAALTVDGRARGLVGQARCQPRVARDVEGLLANLGYTAADHLADLPGRNATAFKCSCLNGTQQVGGNETCQAFTAKRTTSTGPISAAASEAKTRGR